MSDRICAQMYNLRAFCKTPADIANSLKRVAEIGYTAVQLSGLGPIDAHELKDYLDRYNLKVIVTHNSFDRLYNNTDECIADHKLWGCSYVGIGSMPRDFRGCGEKGFYEFAKAATEISKRLSAAGMTFTYHNHAFEFVRFGKKTGMDIIMENTPPEVQPLLDLFWVQAGGGDPAQWIDKYAGRVDLVHAKDFTMDEQGERLMTEVGDGNLNWPRILESGKKAGVKCYIVERDSGLLDPFDSLAISLKNMREMGL